MGQTNYMKIVWITLFLAFAGISCWATAESLHLLLDTWPKVFCYVISIGFFLVASFGTKMIVDSLNQNIYMENRGWKLMLGAVVFLTFWLVCSMPTNTHTFFYRSLIENKVNADITMTRGYLTDIVNNTKNKDYTLIQINDLENKVIAKMGELEAEIKNDANPGDGPKAREIRRELADLLGVAKIEALSYKDTSKKTREQLVDAYRQKVYILLESKKVSIANSVLRPNENNINTAKTANGNLGTLKGQIDTKKIDLNDTEHISLVCSKLDDGYNAIKINKDFVLFKSEADKAKYTAANPVTDVKRLISVVDTWGDFVDGKFAGMGFTFWIVISILIDIAAFIFFDLSFKKEE